MAFFLESLKELLKGQHTAVTAAIHSAMEQKGGPKKSRRNRPDGGEDLEEEPEVGGAKQFTLLRQALRGDLQTQRDLKYASLLEVANDLLLSSNPVAFLPSLDHYFVSASAVEDVSSPASDSTSCSDVPQPAPQSTPSSTDAKVAPISCLQFALRCLQTFTHDHSVLSLGQLEQHVLEQLERLDKFSLHYEQISASVRISRPQSSASAPVVAVDGSELDNVERKHRNRSATVLPSSQQSGKIVELERERLNFVKMWLEKRCQDPSYDEFQQISSFIHDWMLEEDAFVKHLQSVRKLSELANDDDCTSPSAHARHVSRIDSDVWRMSFGSVQDMLTPALPSPSKHSEDAAPATETTNLEPVEDPSPMVADFLEQMTEIVLRNHTKALHGLDPADVYASLETVLCSRIGSSMETLCERPAENTLFAANCDFASSEPLGEYESCKDRLDLSMATAYLDQMASKPVPSQKLECIFMAAKETFRAMDAAFPGRIAASDDFLPVFIRAVSSCCVKDMCSQLEYVRKFASRKYHFAGEPEYFFASCEFAVEYILRLESAASSHSSPSMHETS
jgi:hypothetical protein